MRQCLLVAHYRRKDWDDWLAANGLQEFAADSPRMSFDGSVLTLQAALHGLGIAIGQPRLLAAEFDAGLLLRPFADGPWKPLRRERAYYLLCPQHQRETRKTRAFRDWLLQTVQDLPPLPD